MICKFAVRSLKIETKSQIVNLKYFGAVLVLTAYVAVGVSMQCVVSLALKSEDSTIKWQYTVCHGCLISD